MTSSPHSVTPSICGSCRRQPYNVTVAVIVRVQPGARALASCRTETRSALIRNNAPRRRGAPLRSSVGLFDCIGVDVQSRRCEKEAENPMAAQRRKHRLALGVHSRNRIRMYVDDNNQPASHESRMTARNAARPANRAVSQSEKSGVGVDLGKTGSAGLPRDRYMFDRRGAG